MAGLTRRKLPRSKAGSIQLHMKMRVELRIHNVRLKIWSERIRQNVTLLVKRKPCLRFPVDNESVQCLVIGWLRRECSENDFHQQTLENNEEGRGHCHQLPV